MIQVQSLGWEDPPEEEMATHWQPTPLFLPGKPHGWMSLVGHSPWGHKESDTVEHLTSSILAWRIPWTEEPVHRVSKSWIQLE